MPILVTGTAGFIGFHVARRLLARGETVLGLDVVNDYYDTRLKEARLDILRQEAGFTEVRMDLADRDGLMNLLQTHKPDRVINLAAQAGVRYSVENPFAYVDSNLVGFVNLLEGCKRHGVGHLVYASTSSVYGANAAMPFHEGQVTAHQMSLYAATKKANEVMAHSYAHLHGLPCTGLRFFTVYGPWGRPDMALFKWTKAILEGRSIDVYNNGDMSRDFTYIDDIVESIVRIVDIPATPDPSWRADDPATGTSGIAPYRIYNIGRGEPQALMEYLRIIEDTLGRKAEINFLPMQMGDVAATWADTSALEKATGYKPSVGIDVGVRRFVEWYRAYYGV
ncbi:dTDP-glucose 4,6-dehydratase [Caenispirillum salinarum AK4]|uniref:dTDP-glucose 4,6-dehydratase n=1 Tax=Caenispirillum salinarum AK4 TaxID=1238182 RepID=K9GP60_9PROT|nr:NAD-dependent epimerase [Caenispirillum salinarum]EKV26932.1 dTDP-glucose 4,6-dehydratase [Caenispirillum salinarum AK4]